MSSSWGERGEGQGQFDFHDDTDEHSTSVGGLAVVDDVVFVADQNRVQMYDLDRQCLGAWSGRGRRAGQILKPAHMAAGFDGNIYLLDATLANVQVFDPRGKLQARFAVPVKNIHCLSTICANPDGEVFVAEEEGGSVKGQPGVRIYQFAPGGDLAKTWATPNDDDGQADPGEFVAGTSGMACGPDGRICRDTYRSSD